MIDNRVEQRCGWLTGDPLYIKYHDEEWGRPEYNNYRLFEMICLEGQQAGLSWITILKKRDYYRELFHNFDPYKVARLTDKDVQSLLNDIRIVRHKGKIESIINNAKCYVKLEENENQDFSDFIWNFVSHVPVINRWNHHKEVPSETETSLALSKALKKRGFKYVGSKICYAFMQACGLVNNHLTTCICYKEMNNKKIRN